MRSSITLFISMFTTLLAIVNPLEAIPVFLGLMKGKDSAEQNRVARKSCFYALPLAFFFLLFGTLLLRLFGVSPSMIRVVGGIILTRIGFQNVLTIAAGKSKCCLRKRGGFTSRPTAHIPIGRMWRSSLLLSGQDWQRIDLSKGLTDSVRVVTLQRRESSSPNLLLCDTVFRIVGPFQLALVGLSLRSRIRRF